MGTLTLKLFSPIFHLLRESYHCLYSVSFWRCEIFGPLIPVPCSPFRRYLQELSVDVQLAAGAATDSTIAADVKSWEREPHAFMNDVDVNGDGEIICINPMISLFPMTFILIKVTTPTRLHIQQKFWSFKSRVARELPSGIRRNRSFFCAGHVRFCMRGFTPKGINLVGSLHGGCQILLQDGLGFMQPHRVHS